MKLAKATALVRKNYILLILFYSKCQFNEAFQHPFGIVIPTFTASTSTSSRRRANNNLTPQPPLIHVLYGEKYGKGAEIYPATNEIRIKLTDSFPNNAIPSSVQGLIIDNDNNKNNNNILEETMNTILQSAAKSEQTQTSNNNNNIPTTTSTSSTTTSITSTTSTTSKSTSSTFFIDPKPISKPPIIISILLLLTGLIPPIQIITVIFFTGYLLSLTFLASSPKSETNLNPIIRSLPPTSHVPTLVNDPLVGSSIGKNQMLVWNGLAVIIGYIAPILYFIQSFFVTAITTTTTTNQDYNSNYLMTMALLDNNTKSIIATNIFLISCQIISENISRKVLTPLPIKILIPIMYNTVRMGSLYSWMMCWSNMDMVGQGLALVNFVYWGFNLFGFLIPIAAMRYMRSYFFGVEAEEVLVREGDEDNIGLLGK